MSTWKVEGKVVTTKGSLCFQEVVDSFVTSKRIAIATYSLSPLVAKTYHKYGGPEVKFEIISNVPNLIREKASLKDREFEKQLFYLRKLSAQTNAECYVNLYNHAKVVIGDAIAYIGSANFSYGSKSNHECGLIIRGSQDVNAVYQQVFVPLRNASRPFLGTKTSGISMALSSLLRIADELLEQIDDYFDQDLCHELMTFCDRLESISSTAVGIPEIESLFQEFDSTAVHNIRSMAAGYDEVEWKPDFDQEKELQNCFNALLEEYPTDDIDQFASIAANEAGEAEDANERTGELVRQVRPKLIELRSELFGLVTELGKLEG